MRLVDAMYESCLQGTALYIARAVQNGKYLSMNRPYRVPQMPQLEGRALKLYEKHFGQEGTRSTASVEQISFANLPNFLQSACTSHAMMSSHISG